MNNSIVRGSLSSVARDTGTSVEEAFLKCDVVVIVDVSGSMGEYVRLDDGESDTRFNLANSALRQIQDKYPGRVALLQFSDTVRFMPNGELEFDGRRTEMGEALHMARAADLPGIKFILVSDGFPNNEHTALDAAKRFTQPIHTIYIGVPGGDGQLFLEKLSRVSGGTHGTSATIVQDMLSLADKLLTVNL